MVISPDLLYLEAKRGLKNIKKQEKMYLFLPFFSLKNAPLLFWKKSEKGG